MSKFAEKKGTGSPAWEKTKEYFARASAVIHGICSCIFKLRKLLMAVPVIWGLAYLTYKNLRELPAQVGIGLQNNGEYAAVVSRELALFGPVGLTVLCLLLMFASKKTLQPWVISLFSLALPLLIWVTNVFPA